MNSSNFSNFKPTNKTITTLAIIPMIPFILIGILIILWYINRMIKQNKEQMTAQELNQKLMDKIYA